LIQAVIAFVCAVEPSPLSVPVEQLAFAALLIPPAADEEDLDDPPLPLPLPLLLHAASAVTASSTPAARPARLSFTFDPFLRLTFRPAR
jgi:hypothetical protein